MTLGTKWHRPSRRLPGGLHWSGQSCPTGLPKAALEGPGRLAGRCCGVAGWRGRIGPIAWTGGCQPAAPAFTEPRGGEGSSHVASAPSCHETWSLHRRRRLGVTQPTRCARGPPPTLPCPLLPSSHSRADPIPAGPGGSLRPLLPGQCGWRDLAEAGPPAPGRATPHRSHCPLGSGPASPLLPLHVRLLVTTAVVGSRLGGACAGQGLGGCRVLGGSRPGPGGLGVLGGRGGQRCAVPLGPARQGRGEERMEWGRGEREGGALTPPSVCCPRSAADPLQPPVLAVTSTPSPGTQQPAGGLLVTCPSGAREGRSCPQPPSPGQPGVAGPARPPSPRSAVRRR